MLIRKREYCTEEQNSKIQQGYLPNVYVKSYTYDGILVRDHNNYYLKSRSELNLHFKDGAFSLLSKEEDDFIIHPDLFLKIDLSSLDNKEQLNYWYDNRTKVHLMCDSWNGQIPPFLADIKETEKNHFKLNILSHFKNDLRVFDGEGNTIKVMLDLNDIYFTLHKSFYDDFVHAFWNNVDEEDESVMVKYRNKDRVRTESDDRERDINRFMKTHSKLNSIMEEACREMDTLWELRDDLGDLIPEKAKEELEYIYRDIFRAEKMLRQLKY